MSGSHEKAANQLTEEEPSSATGLKIEDELSQT
jgi:hypothetical protein